MSSSSKEAKACCGNIFNCTKKELVQSGFFRTKIMDNIICCGCGWESGDIKLTIRHINLLHKIMNPDCIQSKNVPEQFDQYVSCKSTVVDIENTLKETFANWTKSYPKIEDMIQTGFYYTGNDDYVTCIDCGLQLGDWQENDVPKIEHKKYASHCILANL